MSISERLPPEEMPVYTLSGSGLIGVYARFGNNYSSLISTDNEDIEYWHESSVAQQIKRLKDALAEIRMLIDIFPSTESAFKSIDAMAAHALHEEK